VVAGTGPWKTVAEVELATLGSVHWHNPQRLNAYLDDRPPVEFEQLHAHQITAQRQIPARDRSQPAAARPEERLPGYQPEVVEERIASEPSTALTAAAPQPADGAPVRALAD
jgi:hypothetical protein